MSCYTDETLTAFLDGELAEKEMMTIADALENDVALVNQVAALQVDFAAARDGFAALLAQAPKSMEPASNVVPLLPRPRNRWLPLAVAAAFAMVVGVGIGRSTAPEPAPAKTGWIVAVANYVRLYDKNSLPETAPSQKAATAAVARVSNALGIQLDLANLQVDGLEFYRAQTLSLNGKPLAQFMFADEHGIPVAICVIKSAKGDKPMSSKKLNGLNAAMFSQDGFAYLVIGDKDADAVQSIAGQLQAQI